jgi:hypothetical protein
MSIGWPGADLLGPAPTPSRVRVRAGQFNDGAAHRSHSCARSFPLEGFWECELRKAGGQVTRYPVSSGRISVTQFGKLISRKAFVDQGLRRYALQSPSPQFALLFLGFRAFIFL